MTFTDGTITSEANPAAKLYTDYLAAALSSAGFTLVDTVTISTRTHKVWKSAAGDNIAGLDWYLDVAYTTTGAGSVWMLAFENYDAATDLGYRGPMGTAVSATIVGTYYTRYESTGQALETNWTPRAGDTSYLLATSTSSFYFAVSITTDRVIWLTSVSPTQLQYCGLYDPDPNMAANAGASLFPLWQGFINLAGSSAGALNRAPKYTGSETLSRLATPRPAINISIRTPVIPTGSTAIYGGGALTPVPISTDSNAAAHATWGYPYDVGVGWGANTVARGDTVTIDSDTWVLTSYDASGITGFKAV